MKKLFTLTLLLGLSLAISAQTYTRHAEETAEEFVNRIKPQDKELDGEVFEANWNHPRTGVIVAFWREYVKQKVQSDTITLSNLVGMLYVPVDDHNNYKAVVLDRLPQNPLPANPLSVFFHDTDGDGESELIFLFSWESKRDIKQRGAIYEAFVYDYIDYNNLPKQLTKLEYLDGGTSAMGDDDERLYPIFTNAAELKAILEKRGDVNYDSNVSFKRLPAQTFEKNMTGTIGGNMEVAFRLNADKGHVYGFYFYKKRGIDIDLIGTIIGEQLDLYELDNNGKRVARITGVISGDEFEGTWASMKTQKSYPLSLKQSTMIFDRLPDISGLYIPKGSDGKRCNINVNILSDKGLYNYVINTPVREVKGAIRFHRATGENILYVEFERFPWAEYKGNVSQDRTIDDTPITPMYGLEGIWSDGKISFQNYGNSMNYYVKLEGCDAKYVELEREDYY